MDELPPLEALLPELVPPPELPEPDPDPLPPPEPLPPPDCAAATPTERASTNVVIHVRFICETP